MVLVKIIQFLFWKLNILTQAAKHILTEIYVLIFSRVRTKLSDYLCLSKNAAPLLSDRPFRVGEWINPFRSSYQGVDVSSSLNSPLQHISYFFGRFLSLSLFLSLGNGSHR